MEEQDDRQLAEIAEYLWEVEYKKELSSTIDDLQNPNIGEY